MTQQRFLLPLMAVAVLAIVALLQQWAGVPASGGDGDGFAGQADRLRALADPGVLREIRDAPSCLEYAAAQSQPFSEPYAAVRRPVGGGGVHAFHRWEGEISREDFLAAESCEGCGARVYFKVLDGRLYVRRAGAGWDALWRKPELEVRYRAAVEMLLVASRLFALANADVLLNFEDENPCGLPALTYGPNPSCPRSGFAMPSWSAYMTSRGPAQMDAMFWCLDVVYPRRWRMRRAVWRGSTTGVDCMNLSNYMTNARVRAAFLGRFNADVMDVGLSSYVQLNETDEYVEGALQRDVPLVQRIEMEDFNEYEVIIDLDGNAWSDRLFLLAHYNTPILKQRSSSSWEYYGHLLKNGTHALFFHEDLSDFMVLMEGLLARCRREPRQCEKMVRNMQGFAREHLSHLGVLRAAAYVVNEVAKKSEWTVEYDAAYTEISPSLCCVLNPTLPAELIERVANSGSGEGDPSEQLNPDRGRDSLV